MTSSRLFVLSVAARSGDSYIYGPFESEQAATEALPHVLTSFHEVEADQFTTDSEDLWEETGVSFVITDLIPVPITA